jgi:hypothetical protein
MLFGVVAAGEVEVAGVGEFANAECSPACVELKGVLDAAA